MEFRNDDQFRLDRFEPVGLRGTLYGQTIVFNHIKRHIKFTSQFHGPDYVSYSQVEGLTIAHNRKRGLLWLGILTFFLVIGVFILFIRIRVPPYKLTLRLKNESKPIVIRPWLDHESAARLADFCGRDFHTILLSPNAPQPSLPSDTLISPKGL